MKKLLQKKKENIKKRTKKLTKKGVVKEIKKKIPDKKVNPSKNKKTSTPKKTKINSGKKIKPKTAKDKKNKKNIKKENIKKENIKKENINNINKEERKKKETLMTLKKTEKKAISQPAEKKEKTSITTSKINETISRKEPETIIKTAVNISAKENVQKPMMVNQNTPYFTILFVCTGNMCRSPLAEGIMKKKIEEEFTGDEKDLIMIHSCGTYAYEGNKPAENALKTSRQNNTDISYIRSKPLTKMIADEADIIFAMSVEHMNYIIENFLSAKNKTFLLKQFGENRLTQMSDSIPDPMGFTIEYYAKTYQEIKNAIDKVFPLIKENIQKKLQNKVEKTN